MASLDSPPVSLSSRLRSYIEGPPRLKKKDVAKLLEIDSPRFSMALSEVRPLPKRSLIQAAELFNTTVENLEAEEERYKEWRQSHAGPHGTQVRMPSDSGNFVNGIWSPGAPLVSQVLRTLVERHGLLTIQDGGNGDPQAVLLDDDDDLIHSASIDLSRGTGHWFRNGNKLRKREIGHEQIWIAPGDSLYLETRETIHMPANMVGRLGLMSYFVRKGVVMQFGLHLNPGWIGKPFFTLHHWGDPDLEDGREADGAFPLDFGEHLVSLELTQLSATPDVNDSADTTPPTSHGTAPHETSFGTNGSHMTNNTTQQPNGKHTP